MERRLGNILQRNIGHKKITVSGRSSVFICNINSCCSPLSNPIQRYTNPVSDEFAEIKKRDDESKKREEQLLSSATKMQWAVSELKRENRMLVDVIRSNNMTPGKKLPFDVDEVTVATAASSVPSIHRREPDGMGGWKD